MNSQPAGTASRALSHAEHPIRTLDSGIGDLQERPRLNKILAERGVGFRRSLAPCLTDSGWWGSPEKNETFQRESSVQELLER